MKNEKVSYEITDNLRVTHYRNGDLIYEARTDEEFERYGKDKIGCFCRYAKEDDTEKYGFLYNWYAVNDQRGLAPSGYHIPTDKEFDDIKERFMKTALPGGNRGSNGAFYSIGDYGGWWSATEYNATYAWYRSVNYDNSYVNRDDYYKEFGFSVRCVRD